jgi:hypothetical protein
VVAPLIGSFLLAEISPVAPGITGSILMVGVATYTWHRILFVPDLECEEYD